MLRVAIIGRGGLQRTCRRLRIKEVQMVAFCDIIEERAQKPPQSRLKARLFIPTTGKLETKRCGPY